MRIHIAGGLTTKAFEIGQALASRLGLDYLSAPHNFKFPVTYTEDRAAVLNFWESHEDCVVNALSIPIMENDDAIHIMLESELIAERNVPGTFFLQRQAELQFVNYMSMKGYRLVINTTGLTVDYVVQHIIDCIVNGDSGHFMPIGMLLPDAPVEELSGDLEDYHLYTNRVFRVKRFYSSCILVDDFEQAQLYAYHNKMLKVNVYTVDKLTPLTMKEYEDWSRIIDYDNYSARLGIMLSKYCAKFALYDSDETYCTLAQNGNPYKKLIEMGFRD